MEPTNRRVHFQKQYNQTINPSVQSYQPSQEASDPMSTNSNVTANLDGDGVFGRQGPLQPAVSYSQGNLENTPDLLSPRGPYSQVPQDNYQGSLLFSYDPFTEYSHQLGKDVQQQRFHYHNEQNRMGFMVPHTPSAPSAPIGENGQHQRRVVQPQPRPWFPMLYGNQNMASAAALPGYRLMHAGIFPSTTTCMICLYVTQTT